MLLGYPFNKQSFGISCVPGFWDSEVNGTKRIPSQVEEKDKQVGMYKACLAQW